LWSGKFKGLDSGMEDYEIPPHIWEYIAESWGFWFMYLAPILLEGRFKNAKYHVHLCDLVDIMKTCTQFSITCEEINVVERKIVNWVQTYKRYYYQYRSHRLSTCTLTIHGLLHIPDNIRFCGPVWSTWTYWMERYCGYLKIGLRSRKSPWADLANRVLHKAYLDQVEIQYDLKDKLEDPKKKAIDGQYTYEDYPHSIFGFPYHKSFKPDDIVQQKIAGYFLAVTGKAQKNIIHHLPDIMPTWGKVKIANGGDSIRCSADKGGRDAELECNTSYVWYELEVVLTKKKSSKSSTALTTTREIFYGQLEQILVCELPEHDFWGPDFAGTTRILALITPCVTNGLDAVVKITKYSTQTTPVITDIRTISSVVGRIFTQGSWGIIDRSTGYSRTEFLPSDV
ncbi:hypothetical protein BDQ12DRAFT_766734, partial [Crucibulum laeve]